MNEELITVLCNINKTLEKIEERLGETVDALGNIDWAIVDIANALDTDITNKN